MKALIIDFSKRKSKEEEIAYYEEELKKIRWKLSYWLAQEKVTLEIIRQIENEINRK